MINLEKEIAELRELSSSLIRARFCNSEDHKFGYAQGQINIAQKALKIIDAQAEKIEKLKEIVQQEQNNYDNLMEISKKVAEESNQIKAENFNILMNFAEKQGEIDGLKGKLEWRPIESAPRDGTVILVFGGLAYWFNDKWYSLSALEYPGRAITWKVEHWMPLPEKPNQLNETE